MKLKTTLASLCLLTLSSTASAGIIDSIDGTTINWSGTCSDCLGVKGDDSFTNTNEVSGNIILDGFVFGEDFDIDTSNFMSFQYNGPSNHVDNLILYNALYSDVDQWGDASDWMFSQINSPIFFGEVVGEELPSDYYAEFSENMLVDGWIAGDLSSYWLDLSFDTYVPIDPVTGEYIKMSSLLNTGEQAMFQLINFDISYASNGDWSISANNVPYDIGNNAQASIAGATEVPEPSSLAIFSAALLGLLRLRKKA